MDFLPTFYGTIVFVLKTPTYKNIFKIPKIFRDKLTKTLGNYPLNRGKGRKRVRGNEVRVVGSRVIDKVNPTTTRPKNNNDKPTLLRG